MQAEVSIMSDKIKKFFAKKKADIKFKTAGPGHRLADDSSSSSGRSGPAQPKAPAKRVQPSEESRLAAQAALARLSTQNRDLPGFNTSLQAIKAQVKRELEAEKSASLSAQEPGSKETTPDPLQVESPHLAATGVYFRCPLISEQILPRDEWKANIKAFLYDQLAEEAGLTACLIIQSCNTNREKISNCVDTLCKYFDNIISNPAEEKYQKIRMSNRVFMDKVQPVEGAMELLTAAGFSLTQIKNQDGLNEDFMVFDPEKLTNLDDLNTLIDALRNAEPIPIELDRNVQVLLPSQAAKKTELPLSFYSISPEEIKKERQARLDAIEKSQVLRTKAMREKDEQREMRKYQFALIRVRFPDGILLQGTFYVYEPVKEIYGFVQDHLEHDNLPFVLNTPSGHKIIQDEDNDKSLIEMRLVPATILTFQWDTSVADEVGHSEQKDVYLKPEVMLLVREI